MVAKIAAVTARKLVMSFMPLLQRPGWDAVNPGLVPWKFDPVVRRSSWTATPRAPEVAPRSMRLQLSGDFLTEDVRVSAL